MDRDSIEDFLSYLCKDITNAVDIEDLTEATKLSANTLACFALRTKPQLPNTLQLTQMLLKVFQLNPGAGRRIVAKYNAFFCMTAVNLAEGAEKAMEDLLRALRTPPEQAFMESEARYTPMPKSGRPLLRAMLEEGSKP